MFSEQYTDLSELAYGLTYRLAYAKADELDVVSSTDTQLHNVMVKADSLSFEDFDLKSVWLTRARWGAFIRQYINPDAYSGWMGLVDDKLRGRNPRGVSFMRTEVVKPRRNATIDRVWRRWGSCILGFGFRMVPEPQLTMHSRTSYVGYMGELDLALAHVLGRDVAALLGLSLEDIRFVWHLEAAQFHGFKTLAWFQRTERDWSLLTRAKAEAVAARPTLALARKNLRSFERMDREGTLYSDMKFAQLLRLRQRYHTEVHGYEWGSQFEGGPDRPGYRGNRYRPLPSVGVHELDLLPVLRKGASDHGEDMSGGYDDQGDDDE